MKDGPARAIMAMLTLVGAPEVAVDHHRYDVAMTGPDPGIREGFIEFSAAEGGDYVFFLGVNTALSLEGPECVALPSDGTGPACPEVKSRVAVNLPAGSSLFKLGPTAAATVPVVVERAAR